MEEFLPIEIKFLAAIDQLPEAYRGHFLPPLDDGLRVPAEDKKVGDLVLQIYPMFIHVRIGDHTEMRFTTPKAAVAYIDEVLSDQMVFYFDEGGVECFQSENFSNLSEIDWNYFVWSGPFRYAFLERD